MSIVLALVCLGLAIVLVTTKRSQATQHQNDADAITDYSNKWTAAQTEINTRQDTILTLSNSLDETVSNSLAVSNRMSAALSTMASEKEQQSTNLNRRVAEAESENQTLVQRVNELTNQLAGFSQVIVSNRASMNTASNDFFKNYTLLENRLRRDVAERVLVERQFNNPTELRTQLDKLKGSAPRSVTPQNIYQGLDIEVESNGTFHVVSPE